MESLNTIGINHKTAPIDIREKVAFDTSNIKHALNDFKQYYPKDEVAILSTCNRTEIYSTTPSSFDTFHGYHSIIILKIICLKDIYTNFRKKKLLTTQLELPVEWTQWYSVKHKSLAN